MLDGTPAIKSFLQRGRKYSYASWQELFSNLALPALSSSYVSYSVLPHAPVEICEQVEIALYAVGTTATNDIAYAMKVNREIYASSNANSNLGTYLFCFLPIGVNDYNVDFASANGEITATGHIKGAMLKI